MPDAYFDLEGSCLIWHFVKGLLGSIIPNKGLVFLEEFIHRLGKFREFLNEALIKVSKSKERAYLFYVLGDWPVADSIEFHGVHYHFAFFNNKAKVFFDLCPAKFAFRWFKVKVGFSEAFKNVFGEAFEILFILGKDKNVIHVYNAELFFNLVFDSVIHHCLEC